MYIWFVFFLFCKKIEALIQEVIGIIMATPMPPLKIEITSAQKVFELIISPNEYDNLLNHIINVKYPPTNENTVYWL